MRLLCARHLRRSPPPTEAGFILIGGWLMVPSPFFPPLRLSASLFRRLRCLALCPPAIESERAFERGSRDYVETEEDQLPKSFVCCARIGEKNGSEAETQRLCRRVKARASPSLAHHASQSSFHSLQSEYRGRGRRLGVASCRVGEPNPGRRLEFSGES